MSTMHLLIFFLLPLALFSQSPDRMLYEGPPIFHGAKITGNYPGTPFLFTVPATGKRPILFEATNLPKGLRIDPSSGIITGVVVEKGNYQVQITATNDQGKAQELLQIEIGERLCLTPPMGWNSWNVFTNTLDEKMVMQMADAMVSTGMRDLGYQYINMDDYWHDTARAADGTPVANPLKFPHGIKWLADYVHSRGLKLGIYSDAGDKTCGKCFGGYRYEEIDARTYAEWGVDLLKYDFCFVPFSKKQALERYTTMGNSLKKSGRSIVYSICNWGFFAPWKWGAEVGGNYWRTTPDIFDIWKGGNPWTMSVMNILHRQNKILKYGTKGHWNDPDMLIVGNYGKGKATSRGGKFKGLNDIEYRSHMSLWAMMNAPLLSSCDLGEMNDATRAILLDQTLLNINQDMLGEACSLISRANGLWIYKKELSNGKTAFAFFNSGSKSKIFEPDWSRLNVQLAGETIFTKTETPTISGDNGKYKVNLARHETIVFVISKAKK